MTLRAINYTVKARLQLDPAAYQLPDDVFDEDFIKVVQAEADDESDIDSFLDLADSIEITVALGTD